VIQAAHRVVVVEQGANRLDTINLASGRRQVLRAFANLTGQEGVDGIGAAPNGGLYVPDSPYGTLYLLDKRNRLHLLASGLSRPVDAIRYAGGVAVADENANAVWLVSQGRVQRLATLSIPDDLAVFHGRLLADTLGDGRLWEVRPSVKLLVSGFGQPQGLAVLNSGALVLADSRTNGLYSVSNLQGCL
jgi:DNA-binding beta-propeller fold protein YncE